MQKMMNERRNKGFTLAELLIVVAIIAVLVAIAIPIFTAQLHKSELSTGAANIRSAYAEAVADKLAEGKAFSTVSVNAKVPSAVSASVTSTAITVNHSKISDTETIDVDKDVTVNLSLTH